MKTIEKISAREAAEKFDRCVGAECVDGQYTISGGLSHTLAQAVRPWVLDDLVVCVLSDELCGWGDYTHFIRVEHVDGERVDCFMARAK